MESTRRSVKFHLSIFIALIFTFIASRGVSGASATSDHEPISVSEESQLNRIFFQQETPTELQSIIPRLVTELENLTDEELLQFLKKATERAKQSYIKLKFAQDQLEKSLSSKNEGHRIKRTFCHSCYKKRKGFIEPVPVYVPVPIQVQYPRGGGGCGYGGCGGGGGGGYYPPPQTCNTCGGGSYGGGGGGAMAYASASASSGAWGKK